MEPGGASLLPAPAPALLRLRLPPRARGRGALARAAQERAPPRLAKAVSAPGSQCRMSIAWSIRLRHPAGAIERGLEQAQTRGRLVGDLREQRPPGPRPVGSVDDPVELTEPRAFEPAPHPRTHERAVPRDRAAVPHILGRALVPPVARQPAAVHAVDEAQPEAEELERGVAQALHLRLGHRADRSLRRGQDPVQPEPELRGIRSAHADTRRDAQRPANVTGCLRANATTPLRKSSVCPLAAMACASSSICVSRLSWVDWWKRSLARPKACVGPWASSRASAATAPGNSASGCTRLTSPHSIASRAESTRLL